MIAKLLTRLAVVAMPGSGLSLFPTSVLASADGPTAAQLASVTNAESDVIALTTHYLPTAIWGPVLPQA